MKFGVENRNVNFASPLIERNVATHSHTYCSLIASMRGPTQVQSTYHTRRRGGELTCSLTAAWLSPMLLPNNPFRSIALTAAACSVPCPPAASAKPNVPVMSSATTARGRQLIRAAALLSAALSKSPSRPRSPRPGRHCYDSAWSWISTDISVTCANQSAACGASAAHETSNVDFCFIW